MTSDDISTKHWEWVKTYAAEIANAECTDDQIASESATNHLLFFLDCLDVKYGRTASVLATRADYTSALDERTSLLVEAYGIASRTNDKRNQMLVASSLAQLLIEETTNIPESEKWLTVFAETISNKWDELDYADFQRFTNQLEQLRKRIGPSRAR
jgi:hypothetical protein